MELKRSLRGYWSLIGGGQAWVDYIDKGSLLGMEQEKKDLFA